MVSILSARNWIRRRGGEYVLLHACATLIHVRGAIVKAMAIVTRYPFLQIFKVCTPAAA